MIVTDRTVFLHLHKSGGTFVNTLLMRCVPSAQMLGYHLPYRELPPAFRSLPVLGTVRSPWGYYVSWYHFQLSLQQPNVLYLICSEGGKLDFKQTITNLIGLAGDERRLAEFERALPDHFTNAGLNMTKKCVGELRERNVGFYSFLHERLYAGAEEPRILRMETLREELREALLALRHLPNDCAERFLVQAPPLNASRHAEPARYFDEDLASVVAERDRTVIERYGYSI